MSNRAVSKARKHYLMLPSNYVEELQLCNKRDKSRAFMEYFFDMHKESLNSIRFYGKSWNVSKSTAENWMNDFKTEIDRFFAFWMISNQQQYDNVKSESGQKVDTTQNQNGHLNINQSPIQLPSLNADMDTTQNQNGQKVDEDSNKNLLNINAGFNNPATEPSSKISYSKEFEIIWNLYGKKTSNKKRSFSIYKKRWLRIELKLIQAAIDKYLLETNPTYIKDFDGFLNGLIDSYIPRKAWLKDSKKIVHQGLYFDIDNKFISKNIEYELSSGDIAKYLEHGYFGYIN